jgi:two-component system, cell cycle sensor histidine kinase and response regulator CckA
MTLQLLLVEDSELDAELVLRELRKGGLDFDVRQVHDEPTYVDALTAKPDLVLSDYALPSFDGLSALSILKGRYPDVPFILVSGAIGEELAVAAMREGAADYLLKDRLSRLPTAVRAALDQAALRRENQLLEQRLLRAARLESLGRLSAGIAHDLNNILLPIMLAEQLLRDQITNDDALEVLETIELCALRGARVLRQLLMFGRGTNGARVALRPDASIAEVCAVMRETFPKDIVVRTEVKDDDTVVLADATQLHQILLNLCVNARDAMQGGGTLTIGVAFETASPELTRRYPGSEPGRHVVISVRDTGAGIEPENLERIFDPFFTTKELSEGTGLGLASVLGIVTSYGGFVQVESELHKGTEFKVWLRAHAGGPSVVQRSERPKRASGRGHRVLLVDDEEAIRDVLGVSIARFGYRVLSATDGEAALAVLDAHPGDVDVVLADLAMPRLDGLRLVREIRKRNPTLPVVVMTGALPAEKRAAFTELGVVEFLTKPFQSETLLACLARSIAASGPGVDVNAGE